MLAETTRLPIEGLPLLVLMFAVGLCVAVWSLYVILAPIAIYCMWGHVSTIRRNLVAVRVLLERAEKK